jgi:hypothetical protein
MSIDINVHISADGALVNALSDIASCLAAVSIAKTGNTQTPLPEKTVEAPAEKEAGKELKGTAHTPKEEKAINDMLAVPAPSDPKPDPNAIIDKKLHVSLRKAVGAYCQRMGDNAESKTGKENVRKWLQDRNLQGLSALTYKDMDEFLAFLEAAAKEEVKGNA